MDQLSKGVYRLLERAGVYEAFQRALGAKVARQRFVAELLRPFPGARVLDIGCGTASLLDDLPPDVEYTGYDLNPRYIAEAERRYGSRGRFLVARVGEEPPLEGGFDFAVAKGVLHHLSDEDAGRLIRDARAHLKEGGCLVTSDPVFHPEQSPIARFLISRDRGRRVRTPEGYRGLMASQFSDIEERLVTDLLTVPYSHFFLRATRS